MFPSAPCARLAAACVLLSVLSSDGSAQSTTRPRPYALRNVRLAADEGAPRVTILLRDGRIERILDEGAEPPADARVVHGKGYMAVPAFIDAFSHAGTEMPEPDVDQDVPVPVVSDLRIDMREANRKGIRPAFRSAEVLEFPEDAAKGWREQGFGALLSAPHGELLGGLSALTTTRAAAPRDTIVTPEVFAHASFRARGPGYPGTLMGYMAQLRQFFLDADHQRGLQARYEASRPGPRPVHDVELAAGVDLIEGRRRVMCEAQGRNDLLRWLKLGRETGFQVAFSGARDAWRIADDLKRLEVPVVLTLEWGDEPKDPHAEDDKKKKDKEKPDEKADEAAPEEASWVYEEPLGVREERRREWEETRDGALRLSEAGVAFAFGSGDGSAKDLLANVRKLVEAGLPSEVARGALTRGAAQLLGVERHLGELAAGRDATLSLWTADPLTKDAKLAWLFVDGFPYEFDVDAKARGGKPDEGVDASGEWVMDFKDEERPSQARVSLKMSEDGTVEGTLVRDNPMGEGELTAEMTGHVSGVTLTMEGSFSMGEIEVGMTIEGKLDGDAFEGEGTVKGPWGENAIPVSGTRTPKNAGEVR